MNRMITNNTPNAFSGVSIDEGISSSLWLYVIIVFFTKGTFPESVFIVAWLKALSM